MAAPCRPAPARSHRPSTISTGTAAGSSKDSPWQPDHNATQAPGALAGAAETMAAVIEGAGMLVAAKIGGAAEPFHADIVTSGVE